MEKSKKIVAAAFIVVALGAGGAWFLTQSKDELEQPQSQSTVQTNQVVQDQEVTDKDTLTFSEDKKTVSYVGQTGKTALEILKEKTEVSVEQSSFGEFVTGINGLVADSTKEYWAFYVDGQYGSEGAGTYQTKDGEAIEWKLEAITL